MVLTNPRVVRHCVSGLLLHLPRHRFRTPASSFILIATLFHLQSEGLGIEWCIGGGRKRTSNQTESLLYRFPAESVRRFDAQRQADEHMLGTRADRQIR